MSQQEGVYDDPSASPQVQLAYNQLHSVIDNLDTHVQQLIRRHQAEFILAYRNHLIKVKDELSILKKKSEEQERMTSGLTKINKLERQVVLFREEALKVYSKLEEKTKQCEEYRAKYIEADQNNIRNEEIIKDLSRRLKNVEVRNKEQEAELDVFRQMQDESVGEVENLLNNELSSKPISAHKSMRMTGTISQSNQTIGEILKTVFPESAEDQLALAYQKIHRVIQQREHILTTRLQSYKNKQLMVQIVDSAAMTSDLKQWFLECIKVVKKEIAKRNPNIERLEREVENIKSIQEFLRIDKLRLLELFVSNEKLLSVIYNKLFPDRVSEIQNYLLRKREQDQQPPGQIVPEEYHEHFQVVDKPKVILPKVRKAKESISNRVIIKNGRLNLTN